MKLGLLGFTGNTITDRTANLGIYRPESNEHIQSFNGGPECYIQVGQSPALTGIDPYIDIPGLFIGGDQGQYAFVYNRNTRQVYRYTLDTPWDISTLSTGSVVESRDLNAYLIAQSTGLGNKTNIDANWVDTSANQNFPTGKKFYDLLNGQGIQFSPDGSKMHILDGNAGHCKIVQFTLNTAWDISDGSLYFPPCKGTNELAKIFWTITGTSVLVNSQLLSTKRYLSYRKLDRDFCFSNDGKNLYVLGLRRQTMFDEQVTRFELKSGRTPFDIGSYTPIYGNAPVESSTTISDQNTANYAYKSWIENIYSIDGNGNNRGLSINKSSTKIYLIGTNRAVLYSVSHNNSALNRETFAPSLSSVDNSNNMSYVGVFNGGEIEPQGVFMNTRNNNMDFYIVGNGSKTIFQYKLVLK
jgi:hypothetical protein